MRRIAAGLIAALAVALAATAAATAQNLAGPQGPEGTPARRQAWLIASPDRTLMRATVFRPPGRGPFGLVVINHGSTQDPQARARYRSPAVELEAISLWFVARGFAVVVPQRPGHGETGGPYLEDQAGCDDPDYRKAGLATAASITAAIDAMTAAPFVRRTGVIVVGHSAGGWGALALASRNPRALRAVINFAGGRGGRIDDRADSNCAPDQLVATAGEFGRTAKIPTLWIYAENDGYFGPALARRMAEAFVAAGGRAELHALPAFRTAAFRLLPPLIDEGHLMVTAPEAVAVWGPIVDAFLARVK